MKKNNLDGIFSFKPENVRYLSGFTGTSGFVFITENMKYFITDFRYTQQAEVQCEGFEIILHNKENKVHDILNKMNVSTIGFEDNHMTYSYYSALKKELKNKELISMGSLVEDVRMIKSSDEIELMAKAANIADEAFKHILSFIKPGVREIEVALELEFFMKKKGASGLSFESIVASGYRSSMPHGVASEKVIENGDFVTMDFGCVYEGYCSDMTRTIVVGTASDKQKDVYETVLLAQESALENIVAGKSVKDVDKIARDIITSKGYGEYFGHGLGHGVGLEVHETPFLSPAGEGLLEENMVITDEPGIYIPDFGGVRIEDLVVVTKDGSIVLSKSPKHLIEI